MDPALNGVYVFGVCCHSVHTPNPCELQVDSFFGVTGLFTTFGGGRGRSFEITGLFTGPSIYSVIGSEALLLSYADGIPRTYTDTQGRSWPNVIFNGEYQPDPMGPHITDFGWCYPYRCRLIGLT